MAFPLIHNLFYSWAGWPTEGAFPPEPPAAFFERLDAAWKADGFHLRSRAWTPEQIQMTFQAEPHVAPIFLAARVKGRLQHALRQAGQPCGFSRKVAVRALGDNRSPAVEAYLRKQTVRAELIDERYRATLRAAGFEEKGVDLSAPAETNSGRYWFNLHLVAVTADRFRIGKEDFLDKVRAGVFAWAEGMGCRLKAFAPMPDHVHIAARGNPERSPLALAEALWKSLNRAAGCGLMGENVYAGTFSEYGVGAVWKRT
jgi:REP element-mobilizing transposase RayT